MQISDLMGQYHQAVSAGSEKVTGTKGVENLVSSLKSLTKGNIFEGTVSSLKNGRVTLSLSNGSQVSARLDGRVSLSEGQSMFFQVKSNDGSTIAIRPFIVDGNGVNYTLMQALSAAGLPVEPSLLSMVDKMMEEQMPIDRGSVQQMARLANANGSIDVRTLVQMSKLGIEITPENAAQFENYLGDKQAITAAIDNLIDELPLAMKGVGLSEEALRQRSAQVLSVITEGLKASDGVRQPTEQEVESIRQEEVRKAAAQEIPVQKGQEAKAAVSVQNESPVPAADLEGNLLMQAAAATEAGELWDAHVGQEQPQNADQALSAEPQGAENASGEQPTSTETERPMTGQESGEKVPEAEPHTAAGDERTVPVSGEPVTMEAHTLAVVLDQKQLDSLNGMLRELVGQKALSYNGDKSTGSLLNDLRGLLDSGLPLESGKLERLISSREFKAVIKDALEQQWTMKPEELTGSDKINKLYRKLDGQMNQIENVLRATGQENVNFTQTAADIRNNVDFMNQINQMYTYVQIPLKMSGQTASGELYVYTNKKALAEGSKELTAFLHLDMEHLGPTDVSVRLLNREVSTNFYLENDVAYLLLQEHLPILEERLRAKGYNCKVTVHNETRHVNFVEDFLKKDQPSAGQLHRYSFDMRA